MRLVFSLIVYASNVVLHFENLSHKMAYLEVQLSHCQADFSEGHYGRIAIPKSLPVLKLASRDMT